MGVLGWGGAAGAAPPPPPPEEEEEEEEVLCEVGPYVHSMRNEAF